PPARRRLGPGAARPALRRRPHLPARSLRRRHQPVAAACHRRRDGDHRLRRRLQPRGARRQRTVFRLCGRRRRPRARGRAGSRGLRAAGQGPGRAGAGLRLGRRRRRLRAARPRPGRTAHAGTEAVRAPPWCGAVDPKSPDVRAVYGDVLARLGPAPKGAARGAPAYSRFVNRRIGRYLAAAAYRAGLTPNAVTGVSALFTFSGIALLVALRPSWGQGAAVAALLVLGYAWDSADGQVARLTGTGSPAGAWLDHVVGAV